VTLDEGRFFLPDAVLQFLGELQRACEEYLLALGDRLNLNIDDDAKWRSTGDRAAASLKRLTDMYSELPQRFEQALSFKQIKRV
jgi:hypothetical protein